MKRFILIGLMLLASAGIAVAQIRWDYNTSGSNKMLDTDGNTLANFKDNGSTGELEIEKIDVSGDADVAGDLTIVGSVIKSITSVTANGGSTALTVAQAGYVVVVASTNITLALPAASGSTGISYEIVIDTISASGVAAPTVTLDGNSSETINGATTNADLNNWYDTMSIFCDGDEWFITAQELR